MILSSISYLDCVVFVLLLIPPLLLRIGVVGTIAWVAVNLPFLAIQIPIQFVLTRFFSSKQNRPPFVQRSTIFQDIVIRYVRYAFANLPPSFGQIFLGKVVSLPFVRYRMLRHGLVHRPIKWTEVNGNADSFRAVYIPPPNTQKSPTNVVLYCHGGGFAMASSYFYLEFLLGWYAAMCNKPGLTNPAILAVEYSLVPEHVFPEQLSEVEAAYIYATQLVGGDTSKICVAGDSAGATLVLSLLLHISAPSATKSSTTQPDNKPGYAVLISPWPTLVSAHHKDTPSDYLNRATLEKYGKDYLGSLKPGDQAYEIASPGSCNSRSRWAAASPRHGYLIMYGSEEVLAGDAQQLIKRLKAAGDKVTEHRLQGMVHAWPVAALYLAESPEERLKNLHVIVDGMQVALKHRETPDKKLVEEEILPRAIVQT